MSVCESLLESGLQEICDSQRPLQVTNQRLHGADGSWYCPAACDQTTALLGFTNMYFTKLLQYKVSQQHLPLQAKVACQTIKPQKAVLGEFPTLWAALLRRAGLCGLTPSEVSTELHSKCSSAHDVARALPPPAPIPPRDRKAGLRQAADIKYV